MSNSYYNHSSYPSAGAPGSSAAMRAELDSIATGFDKLPTLSGNGYKLTRINSAGTAVTVAGITVDDSDNVAGLKVNLGTSTLTGTLAQFNTALSDGDFASLAGSETLTNKTLTSPAINGTVTTTGLTLPAFSSGAITSSVNGSSAQIKLERTGTSAGYGWIGGNSVLCFTTLNQAGTSNALQVSQSAPDGAFVVGSSSIALGSGVTSAAFGTAALGCGAITATTGASADTNPSLIAIGAAASQGSVALGAVGYRIAGGSAYNGVDIVVNGATNLSVKPTALTLGSGITSISGGTNPSLNIGTGSLTAGSGTFSASGVGDSNIIIKPTNATAGNRYGGVLYTDNTTDRWYAGIRAGDGNYYIRDEVNSVNRFTFSSTGLAVTGTGTFSGNGSYGNEAFGRFGPNTVSSGFSYLQLGVQTSTGGSPSIQAVKEGVGATTLMLNPSNGDVNLRAGTAVVNGSGLAVTGNLQVTKAAGSDSYINHTTTGLNNTVMGFNNSGSTNAQGIPNNFAYFGSLNAYPVGITTNGLLAATFDTSGNLGLGVTPSGWYDPTNWKTLQIGYAGLFSKLGNDVRIYSNAYLNTSGVDKYLASDYATQYKQTSGAHYWFTAPSGTAGNTVTFSQVMTLDTSGNLLVGTTSGSNHNIVKSVSAGSIVLQVDNAVAVAGSFWGCDSSGFSGANAAFKTGAVVATGRSINAAGTINASGADYAEYENNNGLTIAKGSIVGFKADGTLTLTFSEAVRFGIKSTNPSYVGGDTWGNADAVGERPIQPVRKLDKTEQRLVSEAIPATEDSEAVEAVYETVILEAGDSDEEWAAIESTYEADKLAFEQALEAARLLVDRVAYSGKVPVNVTGATPGDYIVASDDNGEITGIVVADPDFAQYKKAVGRVNRILEDGRAEVAVMVH